MCKFYSCIVTKTGIVLDSDIHDSHEDIIKEHNLKDDKIVNRTWCRIEVTPQDDKYDLPIERWDYKIDELNTIDWHTDKHKKAVLKALDKQIENNCLINKKIKELKNKHIKIIYNSTVSKMWGNSTVSKMWGNSTISKMWGNSTVSEMCFNNCFVRTYNMKIKNHKAGLIMDLSKNRKIIDKVM